LQFGRLYGGWAAQAKERTLALLGIAAKVSPESKAWARDLSDAAMPVAEDERLKRRLGGFADTVVSDFAEVGLKQVGAEFVSFNVYDPATASKLRELNSRFSKDVGRVTKRLKENLGRTLAEGYEAGEGYGLLTDRVGEVFAPSIRSTRPWAARIAATEVGRAANFGLMEGYRQSEIVKKKEWLAAFNARPAHANASGQVRPLGRTFNVGGQKLMYPGDQTHGASAWNVINCRCVVNAVFE